MLDKTYYLLRKFVKKIYIYLLLYSRLKKIKISSSLCQANLDRLEFKFYKKFQLADNQLISPFYSEELSILNNEVFGYIKKRDIKPGDIVIDCGAYSGVFSIYANKKSGSSGKVLAFEPDKKNSSILKKNILLNKCEKIKVIELGVFSEKNVLHFKQEGAGSKIEKNGDSKIKVVDLDSELKRLKIPYEKISFIKIDIEGAEIEAIDGMRKLLAKGKPFLAIATYHIRDGEKTYKKVEAKLKRFGYNVETGYHKHLTTWAWKD
jgi:FkbM family methyltransferase